MSRIKEQGNYRPYLTGPVVLVLAWRAGFRGGGSGRRAAQGFFKHDSRCIGVVISKLDAHVDEADKSH